LFDLNFLGPSGGQLMVSQSANDLKRIRTDHIGSLVRPLKLKESFGVLTAARSIQRN
jgi:hypothetical protein